MILEGCLQWKLQVPPRLFNSIIFFPFHYVHKIYHIFYPTSNYLGTLWIYRAWRELWKTYYFDHLYLTMEGGTYSFVKSWMLFMGHKDFIPWVYGNSLMFVCLCFLYIYFWVIVILFFFKEACDLFFIIIKHHCFESYKLIIIFVSNT